jgi:hypothetical protein
MERGSDKHGPRADDALSAQLRGQLGSAGGHREEWVDPEPPDEEEPGGGWAAPPETGQDAARDTDSDAEAEKT